MPFSSMRFLPIFLSLLPLCSIGQVSVRDSSINVPVIGMSYGLQTPQGDLVSRFGFNSSVGVDVMYKTKRNFLFGGEYRFIFGDKVKEDGILDSIATSNSFIISTDGYPAVIKFYERGYSGLLKFGKIFPMWPNENSGPMITIGAGFLQHKIRIEDISEKAPQIAKDYRKGYDRLSNGPAAMISAGYFYMGNRKYLNWFVVAELYYANTVNRRGYNYDLMQPDTKKRSDMLTGLRFGIMIPFYKKVPDQFYIY